jgi:hypothetical protein
MNRLLGTVHLRTAKLLPALNRVAPLVFIPAIAGAVTLRTPFVEVGLVDQQLVCNVTNFNAGPVDVAMTLTDRRGTPLVPAASNCGAILAPGATCGTVLASGRSATCTVVARGSQLRAAISVFDNSKPGEPTVTVVPATK